MTQLVPYGSGEVSRTRRETRIAMLKLDGQAEFNERAQEYALDLMIRAHARAQLCPEAAPLLAQLLQAWGVAAVNGQLGMYRRY